MPNADWHALGARDARFGAAYRKALADQGIEFPIYADASTTKQTQ
jgi:hypothetical protein